MIHANVFDPFERILALFLLEKKGCTSLTISFDGYGSRHLEDVQHIDINLGFSVQDRLSAMTAEEIRGDCVFKYEDETVKERSFVIKNVLVTDADLSDDTPNGTAFGREVCYPEARFTKTRYQEDPVKVEKTQARPFFGYCYVGKEVDGTLIFYGPRIKEDYVRVIGKVLSGGKEFNVGVLASKEDYEMYTPEVEEVETLDNIEQKAVDLMSTSITTLLHDVDTGVEMPYIFSQNAISVNGSLLKGVENKIIQNLIVLAEIIKFGKFGAPNTISDIFDVESGILRIDVKNGRVTEKAYNDYIKYAAENDVVQKVLEDVEFTDSGVLITHNGKTGALIRRSSKACFAYAITYYVIASYGGGLLAFYSALRTMLSCGALYIADDGIITGNTASGERFTLDYETPVGPRHFEFARTTRKTIPEDFSGFAILGIDLEGNKVVDAPDHYVVAFFVNGVGKVVFDSITSGSSSLKSDTISLSKSKDFLFITFDVTTDKISKAGELDFYA